jgi:hypothetical protein
MKAKALLLAILVVVFAAFGGVAFAQEPNSDKQKTHDEVVVGDLNGDGKVNIQDLSIVLGEWGNQTTNGDANGDNAVNILDLSVVLSNYED